MLDFLRKIIGPRNPVRRFWYWLKAVTAALVYGLPARGMTAIGITGTNGKTTTTHLTEHLLRLTGHKVGMISTVQFSLNGSVTPNTTKLTSVSPFATQKFIRKCRRAGVTHLVIESSSHALDQNRLWGIPFKVGALTNITHEHLDYHRTMEEYKEAKKRLFRGVLGAVLNTADAYFDDFKKLRCPQKIGYGIGQGDLRAEELALSKSGSSFTLRYCEQTAPANLIIPGEFNVENALAATGVMLLCTGVPLTTLAPHLSTFSGVPGRMEKISSPRGFEVIVDFGLTPDALEKIYKTIRASAPARVIGVIGATGDRDKSKRPLLGKIVAGTCDLTIVTDEEPYTENPRVIMEAVLQGALQTGKRKGIEIELVEDRYAAIETAVSRARENDIVVVTGMGNFQTRAMNHGKIPWDERTVVREIIAKNAANAS